MIWKIFKEFKQHSLRNPIVEQVITETLRVVKDIWLKYGNGAKDFFNEIHIELGREMKLLLKIEENSPIKLLKTKIPIFASKHYWLK
jgi:CRISPR-associated endonuclease Csn1